MAPGLPSPDPVLQGVAGLRLPREPSTAEPIGRPTVSSRTTPPKSCSAATRSPSWSAWCWASTCANEAVAPDADQRWDTTFTVLGGACRHHDRSAALHGSRSSHPPRV